MYPTQSITGRTGRQHFLIQGDCRDAGVIQHAALLASPKLPPLQRREIQRGNWHAAFNIIAVDPPFEETHLYAESIQSPAFVDQRLVVFYDPPRLGYAAAAALNAGWHCQFEFIWDMSSSIRAYRGEPLRGHKACSVWSASPKRMKWNIADARIDRGMNIEPGYLRSIEHIPNQSLETGQGKPVEWLSAIYSAVNIAENGIVLDKFAGRWNSGINSCDAADLQCIGIDVCVI